jgi:hypothetical protein
MVRTKNLTLNSTPQELGFTDPVECAYSVIITNTSANKHALVGNGNVSLTNYGIRVEHDGPPVTLEYLAPHDKLYGISEDPNATVTIAIMVIERA